MEPGNNLKKSPFRQGVASDYISHLEALLRTPPKFFVVLYCRVSTPEQEKDGNLVHQVDEAIRDLKRLGIEPVAVFRGVESSRVHGDRFLFQEAIEQARKCGGIVVAVSRDRFLRCRNFDGSNSTETPTNREFLDFLHMANGVPLATLCHPDQPARSLQIKRGQRAKGNPGGRPKKRNWKKRRQARINLAQQLRADGLSLRQIANALNKREDGFSAQTAKTVQNWLKGSV